MVNENDYPNKFKALMDELKFTRDKMKQIEERSKNKDKDLSNLKVINQKLNN